MIETSDKNYWLLVELILKYCQEFIPAYRNAAVAAYPDVIEEYGVFTEETDVKCFEMEIGRVALKNVIRFQAEWFKRNQSTMDKYIVQNIAYHKEALAQFEKISAKAKKISTLVYPAMTFPGFLIKPTLYGKNIHNEIKRQINCVHEFAETLSEWNNYGIDKNSQEMWLYKKKKKTSEASVTLDNYEITLADACYFMTFAHAIYCFCSDIKKNMTKDKLMNKMIYSLPSQREKYFEEWVRLRLDLPGESRNIAYDYLMEISSDMIDDLRVLYDMVLSYSSQDQAVSLVEEHFGINKDKMRSFLHVAFEYREKILDNTTGLNKGSSRAGNVVESIFKYFEQKRKKKKQITFQEIIKESILVKSKGHIQEYLPDYYKLNLEYTLLEALIAQLISARKSKSFTDLT